MIRLTSKTKRFRKESGETVLVYQIKAIKDFYATVLDGLDFKMKFIKKGTLGGYVEGTVILEDDFDRPIWIEQETIITGNKKFSGVTCGYAKIHDSEVGRGTIISGRPAIANSTIGESVIIAGATSIEGSTISEDSLIIGTVIRNSRVGKNVAIKCANIIENKIIGDGEIRGFDILKRA